MTSIHLNNRLVQGVRLCMMLTVLALLLAACGGSSEPRPTPDPTLTAPLVDRSFAGELTSISGESRAATLSLTQDAENDYVFSLDFLYVGRSLRPTNRTGLWYFDGSTLTLDIVEQDGEPVDQPSVVFALAGDQLLGTIFDKSYFDVDNLTLSETP